MELFSWTNGIDLYYFHEDLYYIFMKVFSLVMQALAVLPARTHSGHSTSLRRGAPGPGSKSARARTTRLRTGILKHGDRVIYISTYLHIYAGQLQRKHLIDGDDGHVKVFVTDGSRQTVTSFVSMYYSWMLHAHESVHGISERLKQTFVFFSFICCK